MNEDHLVVAARDLLSQGTAGFSGRHADALVAEAGRQHPAGELYKEATAKAISQRELGSISPEQIASEVYENFIWTHFVSKLLMTAFPVETIDFVAANFDMNGLISRLGSDGPAIISCFHYTGYPLVALGVAMSPAAPLISKARVDVIERAGQENVSDHVVYLSDRSAAIRLTRALKQGRSVWILLDVVLPSVRVTSAEFLGHGMNVGAGLGKIARLSGRPCVPVSWELKDGEAKIQAGPPLYPAGCSEDTLIQEFIDTQAEFIAQQPANWLEWYSALAEAPSVRAEVKRGNEALWARLTQVLT